MKEMKILGETIKLSDDYLCIYELKFLNDNPRVYACTYGEPDFETRTEEEQQDIIYEKLLKEPSVENLIPDIKRHGGLMEPILVRYDTKEVIEGNSRLAVYRKLNEKNSESEWDLIPCDIVSGLTEEQLAAFLHQIHVKGKTQWAAYEKANFAYARHTKKGWPLDMIADLFGESKVTIRTRVDVIKLMMENSDTKRSHFSYYDVLVRNSNISKGMKEHDRLRGLLLKEICSLEDLDPEEEGSKFTAQELRKKIPVILKKPKVLNKFLDGKIDLDEGYQRARISTLQQNVKRAKELLNDISYQEITGLELNEFNPFRQEIRKLLQVINRLEKMIEKRRTTDDHK